MKILTLTTYQGYNYGASLQAYALQTYLRMQGHETEIIRFEPEYLMRHYAFWYVNPESKLNKNTLTRMVYRFAKWVHRRTTLKRKALFDEFNHSVLQETKKVWTSSAELMECPPVADLYVVGSDQVWNVLYDAGRDPVFYLDFVGSGKKASYAASFSFLNLPKEHYERIQKSLFTFDAVSVREYQGMALLDKMGINGTWVLDPVFLIDISQWDRLIDKVSSRYYADINEPYILIYDFEGNDDLRIFAEEYASIHKVKIYAITDRFPLKYADKNFKNAGPVDFIRMIKGCQCFISNSFHGTAFSIIYHKPFYVFNRNRAKVNSRMESLLAMFDLKDRLIDTEEKKTVAMAMEIDWEEVENKKIKQLCISQSFLKNLGV